MSKGRTEKNTKAWTCYTARKRNKRKESAHQIPHDGNGKNCKIRYTAGEEGGGELFSVHTDTTGRNVRSNHDRALAGLEFVENPITLVLLLVTMNSCMPLV